MFRLGEGERANLLGGRRQLYGVYSSTEGGAPAAAGAGEDTARAGILITSGPHFIPI